jgi:hypothetical protein
MAAVKFLAGFICIAVIGSNWGFDGGVVGGFLSPSQGVLRFSRLAQPMPQNDEFKTNGYETIIEIARKEIGVREEAAENSGTRIRNYLEYVGIQSPAPWCAAFVSWCFGQAGYQQPRTAWSPALFPQSRTVKHSSRDLSVLRDDEIGLGLVYGIYYTNLCRIGHCGLTESVRNNWITGIEGNTNVPGSREGEGVYRRIRHNRTISKFADWIISKQ